MNTLLSVHPAFCFAICKADRAPSQLHTALSDTYRVQERRTVRLAIETAQQSEAILRDAMTAHREHDTSALNASQHCAARQIAGIERYALTIKERSDQATESSLFLTGAFETIDIFQYKEIQPWQK